MTRKAPNRTRPLRFRVPNNERVVITVGAERYPGILSVLSITGGALRMTRQAEPGTFAEIRMTTVSGDINAVIEMLVVRPGSGQPFRFVQIDAANRKRLVSALESMEAQGLGDRRADPLQHVIRFARRLMPGASKG